MDEVIAVLVIAFATLVLMSIMAARAFPKGAKVPMQWGITGQPTWYAPVGVAVSVTPILAGAIFAVAGVLPFVSEKAQHDIGRAAPFIAGIFLFVHALHLALARWHFAAAERAGTRQ